jgi:hypothetical protein
MKKIFLSYASKDKWVKEWLVPHLEGYALELLVDYKTFKIGRSSLQNIEDSIDAADFTFFVVSPDWLASEWATLENLIVQTDSPANHKEHFFLLKLEDCELPRRLRPFTYLDLTDAALQASQIKRLMDQLGIPKLTTATNADLQDQKSGSDPLPPISIAPAAIPPTPEPPIEIPPLDSLEAVIAYNQANIDRLQEQLTRPGKVIPFVGAGLSVDYDFKGWWDFLMHLAGQFGVTRQVEQLLSNNQYEEAAQFLMDKMKPHAFHTAIEDGYGPKKLKNFQPTASSRALVKLTAGPVITTNYDAVIEKTFELAGQRFHKLAIGAQVSAAAKAIESHRNILFKLHGDAEENTNRILTLEEYRQHYGDIDIGGFDKDLPLPKVLSRLMSATPLFFLGCSLQVDRTMKVLAEITQALNHGGHYAIVPLPKDPNDLPARRSELSELHIHPIWFDPKGKKGYGMVEELLGFLTGNVVLVPQTEESSALGIQKPHSEDTPYSPLSDTNEQGLKTVRIFLSTSSDLSQERREFEIFINRQNKRLVSKGVFLALQLRDDATTHLRAAGTQSAYNQFAEECDIFVCLIFSKVEIGTKAEFDTALKQFQATGAPLIFIYFQNAPIMAGAMNEEILGMFEFQDRLKALGHSGTEFNNTQDLQFKFKNQLERVLGLP